MVNEVIEPIGTLPGSGREKCARCFGGNAEWNVSERTNGAWKLINNPLAWGGSDPVTAVLGFSKGERQTIEVASAAHSSIPFRGFRRDLSKALTQLGLLDPALSVDEIIERNHPDWAFGSMTRCTISLWDETSKVFRKSGTLIKKYSKFGPSEWIENCVTAHLSRLPSRLRNVVLLSNDDDYVERCFATIRKIHPATVRLNRVAYRTGDVTWAHIVHVGGPGKNHINAWFAGANGTQGDKMRAAQAAFADR
jgi:hypothetical protein